jgi:hypothetical protein
VAASAVVVAITGAPSALAEPIANCTSDVIDGVEVDTCVGNPNATTYSDVPGVNVEFDFGIGSPLALDDQVPRSIESKTFSDCSNGSDVTPSWLPNGWSSQNTMNSSKPSRTATALSRPRCARTLTRWTNRSAARGGASRFVSIVSI